MENRFLKRTWAEVDLDTLANNYRAIQSFVSDRCRIIAVIKADAYGHGAVSCARLLREQGASYFAVSNLEEAIQLRQGGITEPILILSHTPPEEAKRLSELQITQTVISASYGQALHEAAAAANVTVRIHIKVDTGMSRVGFFYHTPDAETVEQIAAICRLPQFVSEGIFTHFAVADEPEKDAYTKHQFELFMHAIEQLQQKGITFSLRHCCNSAATIRFPSMHLDAVRPGLLLYGLTPMAQQSILLTSVMQVKSAVVHKKTVPAGTSVSYGCTHQTQKEAVLATIPVGYADGLSRRLSGNWHMLLRGKPVPLVGRVCMDQSIVDISDLPETAIGDIVTVLGGDDCCSIDAYAQKLDTINYEVICDIGKRVPRIYYRNGVMVDQLNYLVSKSK